MRTTFQLSPLEVAELSRPINGQGGVQTLFRTIQDGLQADGQIALTDAQLGQVLRHIAYRPAGYETRLDTIFGRSIRAMLG